jgi:AraC family transcriptional regulator, positive regulator of tynA and feaB
MLQRGDFRSTPELDYEGWRSALRPDWGRYNPVAMEAKAFTGRVRPRSLFGLAATDLSCNAHRVERTQQDVRIDGVDHYFIVFQVAGGSTIIQNDQALRLLVGDAVLIDSARPGTYVSEAPCGQWTSIRLQLPRQSLLSHLGFEAPGGLCGRGGTAAGRVLFDLVRDADASDGPTSSPADSYMQLAVFDLVGALSARSVARLTPCRQAVRAGPQCHQERLCRSGFRPLSGGRRSGDLVALRAKALHGARLDLQRIHLFTSSGSRGAPSSAPRAAGNRSAS